MITDEEVIRVQILDDTTKKLLGYTVDSDDVSAGVLDEPVLRREHGSKVTGSRLQHLGVGFDEDVLHLKNDVVELVQLHADLHFEHVGGQNLVVRVLRVFRRKDPGLNVLDQLRVAEIYFVVLLEEGHSALLLHLRTLLALILHGHLQLLEVWDFRVELGLQLGDDQVEMAQMITETEEVAELGEVVQLVNRDGLDHGAAVQVLANLDEEGFSFPCIFVLQRQLQLVRRFVNLFEELRALSASS